MIALRNRVASLKKQLQVWEQSVKVRKSELLGRRFVADLRVLSASTSAEASLKGQSALEQQVASLRCQMFAVVSAPSVHAKSTPASVCGESEAASAMIGRLPRRGKKVATSSIIVGVVLRTDIPVRLMNSCRLIPVIVERRWPGRGALRT